MVNAFRRGAITGGTVGVALGLAIHFILAGTHIVWMVVGLGVFGTLFGIWASTMVGVSVRDIKVAKFDKQLKQGQLLLMVDVPAEREENVTRVIRRHHPEVVIDKIRPRDKRKHGGEGH